MCHRSSNCPMCWQPISLKDRASQQLLESMEQERSLRANRSRTQTEVYHPSLENLELHSPTDAGEVDLEEHIYQHLAAAAAMRSGQYVFRREGQRNRSSSQRHQPFFVFSTPNGPHDASVLTAINLVGGGGHVTSVSLGSASVLRRSSPDASVPVPLSTSLSDEDFSYKIRSNVEPANRQRVLSETQSFASQPSLGSQYTEEPSDLQSLSESLRTRFNSWSMRSKESISRNTRGLKKERLIARRNSVAELGSEVRREVNSGIAGLSRLMERLDSRVNKGSDHVSQSSHSGRGTRNDNSNE
ncbi:E3 ubiquitin-protein ligase RHF2A-like isoform X2 [Chenopodium quinoa]|uniref:E3 ubiquitin-protein ligase RHF2A-like isoform X2 n=2 Tax=Chenopodium quinoa TaxID=63459 RepID=UPI000B797C84|nr:E3 ubiquitin-protein ligase RHF2A-like isoform X2 [Chenopodium quinoa]